MIGLFKKNLITQICVLIIATVVMWIPVLLYAQSPMDESETAVLYAWIRGLMGNNTLACAITSLLLTLVEGVWLSSLLYNYRMVNRHTLMPALLFSCAMAISNRTIALTPSAISNLFVIAATSQLLLKGNVTLPNTHLFNASALLAMAMVSNTAAIAYLVPTVAIVFVYKLYQWREIVTVLLGLLAPLLLLGTILLIADQLASTADNIWRQLSNIHLSYRLNHSFEQAVNIFYLILFAIVLATFLSRNGDRINEYKNNSTLLLLPTLAALAMVPLGCAFPFDTQNTAVPMAFAGSLFFHSAKKRLWIYNTLLFLLTISPLYPNI